MDQAALQYLFLDERDSDVMIRFGNEEPGNTLSIPVHSFILNRTSDVFKVMLENGAFKESHTNLIEVDIVGDVSVGLHFVKYLYTKTLVALELDLYIILMKMAHMYNIHSLLKVCEERLHQKLDASSVCRLYQDLEAISSQEFRNHCMNYMFRFAFVIFMDCRHVCLNESTMKCLLESDALNAVDEAQVLAALWHWGRVRCIQENRPGNVDTKSAVANLLPYIRWSLLEIGNTEAPWFNLAVELKGHSQRSRARNEYVPSASLNDYAEKLKLERGYGNSVMDFKGEGKYQMLMFSSRKDILVSGISFIVCLKNRYSWKDSLRIVLNDTELNENVLSEEVSKNHYLVDQQNHKGIFSYRVKVELLKPVYIKHASINILYACINDKNRVAFPQYIKSSARFLKGEKEEEDLLFSVHGKISSIATLFYFQKK